MMFRVICASGLVLFASAGIAQDLPGLTAGALPQAKPATPLSGNVGVPTLGGTVRGALAPANVSAVPVAPGTLASPPPGIPGPPAVAGLSSTASGYATGLPTPVGAATLGAAAADRAETQEFYKLIAEMRKAKDKEAKEEKRTQVQEILSKQLDRDLELREEQLKKIEERAKALREQLDARRESKEEMLKLLMMLVENPSAGFGLPDEWMRTLMRGGRTTGYPTAVAPVTTGYYDGQVINGEIAAPRLPR